MSFFLSLDSLNLTIFLRWSKVGRYDILFFEGVDVSLNDWIYLNYYTSFV
jgi:hypothetical protein